MTHMRSAPRRLSTLVALLVVSALLIPNVFASPRDANALRAARLSAASYTFQGMVFAGDVGDENHPLSGVTMTLYCSNNSGDLGNSCASTTTNSSGWYGLTVSVSYEYVSIVETNPSGYTSVGATTTGGGTVINSDRIRFYVPSSGTHTGNKFWDRAPTTATRTATRTNTTSPHTATPTIRATGTQAVSTNTPSVTGTRPVFTNTPTPRISPTATPGCGDDLLVNGNFEAGLASWTVSGTAGMGPGHNSPSGASLGGTDNATGELVQIVTTYALIPPLRMNLEFWWLAETQSDQPNDSLQVFIRHGGTEDLVRTLPATAPLNQWRKETIDLTSYAGQVLGIAFVVHTDGMQPTMFHLDDITLTVCEQGGPTSTVSPSPTTTSPAGCPDLLLDGNFEGATSAWWLTGSVFTGWGRNGTQGIHLGGPQGSSGELRRVVNIPAGASPVTLEFWWLVESDADHANDNMYVKLEVFGGGGSILVPLGIYWAAQPFGQWHYESTDITPYLTAYGGSTVAIIFGVTKDAGTPTEFVVDDVALRACPGTAATATGTTTPSKTTTGTTTPTKTMTPQPGVSPTATRQPDCRNLFLNGDFEGGSLAPWQTTGGVSMDFGHSGAHGVRLGGSFGGTGSIWQTVTLPAGVSPIRMWFWWRADNAIERPSETFTVLVCTGSATWCVVGTYVVLSATPPLNQWRIQSLDLTPYAGQTVNVIFQVQNADFVVPNTAADPTVFRLDDVVLDVCGVGTPTPPAGTGCQEPLQNGNFEAAGLAPWSTVGAANLGSGRNSPKGIAFCGNDNAMGELRQEVTIPAQGGSVWLKFWWLAEGGAPQPGDTLNVLLGSGMTLQFQPPDLLLTLPATGALGQWREESVDLTGYAGRPITLIFHAQTDGAQPSLFRLDDVSLEACASGGRRYPLYIPLVLKGLRGPEPTPTASLKPPTVTPTASSQNGNTS